MNAYSSLFKITITQKKMTSFEFLLGPKSGETGAEYFEHIGTFLSHRRNI